MSVTHTKHTQYYARSATLPRYRASKLGSRPKNFPAAHYTSAATTSYWPPLKFVCSPLEHSILRSTYLSHIVSRYLIILYFVKAKSIIAFRIRQKYCHCKFNYRVVKYVLKGRSADYISFGRPQKVLRLAFTWKWDVITV